MSDLLHRLNRLRAMRTKLAQEHEGKELTDYNYHAGYSLGYLAGKIYVLEEQLSNDASVSDDSTDHFC